MSDRNLQHMIADAFKEHEVIDQGGSEKCQTWLCKHPDHWCPYWFRVVWAPGFLFLGGDLGEVTTCHSSALPTINQAIGWMRDADLSYWFEKTGQQRMLDLDKTEETLRDWFASELSEIKEDGVRHEIYKRWLFDCNPTTLNIGAYKRIDHLICLHEGIESCESETLWQDFLINRNRIDDYYGSYSIPSGAQWHHAALRFWAERANQ